MAKPSSPKTRGKDSQTITLQPFFNWSPFCCCFAPLANGFPLLPPTTLLLLSWARRNNLSTRTANQTAVDSSRSILVEYLNNDQSNRAKYHPPTSSWPSRYSLAKFAFGSHGRLLCIASHESLREPCRTFTCLELHLKSYPRAKGESN